MYFTYSKLCKEVFNRASSTSLSTLHKYPLYRGVRSFLKLGSSTKYIVMRRCQNAKTAIVAPGPCCIKNQARYCNKLMNKLGTIIAVCSLSKHAYLSEV